MVYGVTTYFSSDIHGLSIHDLTTKKTSCLQYEGSDCSTSSSCTDSSQRMTSYPDSTREDNYESSDEEYDNTADRQNVTTPEDVVCVVFV